MLILQIGKYGLVVNIGDYRAMASMNELLINNKLKNEMIAIMVNGVENFSADVNANKFNQLINFILS